MLLMSPSMPTGAILDHEDWKLVAELGVKHDLLQILNSAMERLLFDGASVQHPAALPGMTERTITVGSFAKELRMIGLRVGWVVAPERFMPDVTAVSLANVVVPVGIAQDAVAVALERSTSTMPSYLSELYARRDAVIKQLEELPAGVPGGGWSLLMRVSDFGIDGETKSRRLLENGVCATAMKGWGRGAVSGHDCCSLSENICSSAVQEFFLRVNELSQRRTAIPGVQVSPPAIRAGLHFDELDGSHFARYVSTEPPRVLLLRPCDYGQDRSRRIRMRGVLACVGDGSIIAQNRGQGVVVMVERGCDDLPLERVVGQLSGHLSVTIEPRYHPRVRFRASHKHQQ
jgi:hypothetical protein